MFVVLCDKTNPTGKPLPIYESTVKPQNQKYFALSEMQSNV